MAGEQAGFTTEQMIDLLHDGLPVETLLELIVWRLTANPLLANIYLVHTENSISIKKGEVK